MADAERVMTSGREIWTPDLRFAGQTVFCLGGGASLLGFDPSALGRHPAIIVNSSFLIMPRAEVLLFSDDKWFDAHRKVVADWPGLAVTPSQKAKAAFPDKIKRVRFAELKDFTVGQRVVRTGPSTGHRAISLAIAMGAARVVLLGYDMRLVDGRSHHHNHYRHTKADLYRGRFLPGFRGWNADAMRAGVTVLNATPGSALTEFPMVDLAEAAASLPVTAHWQSDRAA